MGQVEDRLTAVSSQLSKASGEITGLVQQLRDEVAANAVQPSTLDALEQAAQGLDDVVPDAPSQPDQPATPDQPTPPDQPPVDNP